MNEDKERLGDEETDEQLMAAFARGSGEAFGTLFARYRQPVFGFFCRRVVDRGHAEELTQDTFLAVVVARERYEVTASFRTYLYAIALKVVRGYRRKAVFRAMFHGTVEAEREPGAAMGIDAEIALREAMGKLERVEREILLLREYEELSYAEIAAVLRIPVNTVRSRLFRARMALRELLTTPVVGRVREGLSKVGERI